MFKNYALRCAYVALRMCEERMAIAPAGSNAFQQTKSVRSSGTQQRRTWTDVFEISVSQVLPPYSLNESK